MSLKCYDDYNVIVHFLYSFRQNKVLSEKDNLEEVSHKCKFPALGPQITAKLINKRVFQNSLHIYAFQIHKTYWNRLALKFAIEPLCVSFREIKVLCRHSLRSQLQSLAHCHLDVHILKVCSVRPAEHIAQWITTNWMEERHLSIFLVKSVQDNTWVPPIKEHNCYSCIFVKTHIF